MFNKLYDDLYARELRTTIKRIFTEDDKNCIQLEDNIFYPKGGGQKGDRGTLIIDGKNIQIIDTFKDQYSDDGVLIITKEQVDESNVGKDIKCSLDWNFRYNQMKLHTSVHLHHCMIERVAGKKMPYPQVSSIEETGFAFNRYDSKEITEELVDKASGEFRKVISGGAEVTTYPDAEKVSFRWWECLGYKIPCGGTHVKDISEIGEVNIKYSAKKGKPTVKITLV